VGLLSVAAFAVWSALVSPESLRVDIAPPTFRKIGLFAIPFYVYFVGCALPLVAWGPGLFAKWARSALRLKPGFCYSDAKDALQPFNQLLWVIWTSAILPLVALVFISIAVGAEYNVLMAVAAAVTLASIVLPSRT
jgi:hypothetical protein